MTCLFPSINKHRLRFWTRHSQLQSLNIPSWISASTTLVRLSRIKARLVPSSSKAAFRLHSRVISVYFRWSHSSFYEALYTIRHLHHLDSSKTVTEWRSLLHFPCTALPNKIPASYIIVFHIFCARSKRSNEMEMKNSCTLKHSCTFSIIACTF